MDNGKILGIIPARYASTRFPGKPLAKILDKPMFVHVYERASRCKKLDKVVLATDHQKIFDTAMEYKVPVLMTDDKHTSGTDRVYEAATKLGAVDEDLIINIQGDEPLLDPKMIDELIDCFENPKVEVATLARKISFEDAVNPNVVKVVLDLENFALYFSRAPIPYFFSNLNGNYLGHIGMYGFRYSVLKKFVLMEQSPLEKVESLEQLRLIQNQIPIYVKRTQCFSYGVDTPEDLAKVEKILRKETKACERYWR
jgi:3-deoxy-manno-octulosonate cytidylyltransferase (CMP-KDO synthetase)